MLGRREPSIYGTQTLDEIAADCREAGTGLGLEIDFRQSNHEGDLVTWIQEAGQKAGGVVLNAGAYTHTSIAILDALLSAEVTCVEVHLSNIHQRDEFRHHSFVSKAAKGMICGFGSHGYILAIDALARLIRGS